MNFEREWVSQCTQLALEDTHLTSGGGTDMRNYDKAQNRSHTTILTTIQNEYIPPWMNNEGTGRFNPHVNEPLRSAANDDEKGMRSDPCT